MKNISFTLLLGISSFYTVKAQAVVPDSLAPYVSFIEKQGGWHLQPHGLVHTFWNAANEPAVVMEIYPNQNFEVYLEELNKLLSEFSKKGISPNSEDAIKLVDELDKEWGIITYHDQRKLLMEKYGLMLSV